MSACTYTVSSSSATAFNGPSCPTCARTYVGVHTCSVEDLVRRASELREQADKLIEQALTRFASLGPQPTLGPTERVAGCPCRIENGGSGVCGCTLGGPKVTC